MNPLARHLSNLPNDLVEILEIEFQKLHREYFLGRWEPSQLDAGRFAETVLRVVEYRDTRSFTPIGRQLNRQIIVRSAEQNTNLPNSFRFQIPRLAGLVLDFRNQRNVAHLGTIDVNEMDSFFVMAAANWIVAELIHLETQLSTDDAQKEIKKIIERKLPIIEEIGGRLRCLNPKLSAKEKAMVFCYQRYPESVSFNELTNWMRYSNNSVLRVYLLKLDKEALIDFRNDQVRLTKRGLLWVEKNISFDLET